MNELVAHSAAMREAVRLASRVATTDANVLVTGEPTIYLTDAVRMDISSTQIRRAAQQLDDGEHARGNIQVPPPVAEYINKYRLYREAHETERNDTGRESAHP